MDHGTVKNVPVNKKNVKNRRMWTFPWIMKFVDPVGNDVHWFIRMMMMIMIICRVNMKWKFVEIIYFIIFFLVFKKKTY